MMRQSGFTLIELVVGVAVSAALLISLAGGIAQYNRLDIAKRIDADAQVLLKSMDKYYLHHCTAPVFPVVTPAALHSEGFMVGSVDANPWGSNFNVVIVSPASANPVFRVSATFDTPRDALYVGSFAFNATVVGNVVTWTANSSLSRTSEGLQRQLDREAFGTPLC